MPGDEAKIIVGASPVAADRKARLRKYIAGWTALSGEPAPKSPRKPRMRLHPLRRGTTAMYRPRLRSCKKQTRQYGYGSALPARPCCSSCLSAGPCWATTVANFPSSRKNPSATRTPSLSCKPITHPMPSSAAGACAPTLIPVDSGQATSASTGRPNRDLSSKV